MFSLRSRLIVIVLTATLPGLFLTIYVAGLERQAAFRAVQLQNLATLRLVASSQAQFIASTKAIFGVLAQSNEIFQKDVEGCNTLLDHTMQSSTGYRGFSVSTLDGKSWCLTENLRAAAPAGPAVTNLERDILFRRALDQKGFVVGDFVIGNISKRPNLNFAQPIYDAAGNAVAVLSAGLDLDWLNASISSLKLPEGYIVDILDRDGTYIVRWPEPQDYVGKTYANKPITQVILKTAANGGDFTAEMQGVDDVTRLYAFMRVPGVRNNDLFVNVGIAPELAYAEINAALRQNMLMLILFMILALALALLFSNWIVLRPISAIARAAKEVSTGNLSARTQLKHGQGELSILARDFDEMCNHLQNRTDELERLNAELEKRVQLRTEQLQNAITKLHESRGQLRDLSHQQRELLEQEQTHLSREVHDQIGQALTALKMDLSTLRRRIASNGTPSAVTDKMASMASLIDEAIQTTRAIARRLRPSVLDDLGLGPAIEWYAGDFQQRTGIVCTVVDHDLTAGLSRDVATAAYRIVQEALTNVLRHANATGVLIELAVREHTLTVQVQDNGSGFDPEKLNNPKSLGVLGMRERAGELGGTVEIQKTAGNGTRLIAVLPVIATRNGALLNGVAPHALKEAQ